MTPQADSDLDAQVILPAIREMHDELARKYSVRRIGIFGSFARGEESLPNYLSQ
jgi:predicted nucleotidyltransferase